MFDVPKIISGVKKLFTRWEVLTIIGIGILFFVTRLFRLDSLPIFSDEGIYIHWAKVAWHDATWRFVSLTDGKQPLQTWGTIPFLKLFPNNALLGGRMFSVATGFVGLLGFYSLLHYLFGKKTAILGSFFYVLTPYFMFYDRMALVDSGVNAGFIWMLFFSILLARLERLDIALLFGLISGLSLLAKSSVRLFLGVSALAPTLFVTHDTKKTVRKMLNFFVLFAVVVFISFIIYNVQRLSPFFHFVAEKNKTFIMTPDEFFKNPFSVLFHNIQILPEYILNELALVIGIVGLFGFRIVFQKDRRLALYLGMWFLIPFIIVTLVSKVVFPRYLIFFGTLLVLSASVLLAEIKNKTVFIILTGCILLSFAYYDFGILFKPDIIPFPAIDRGQYIEGATVGLGAREIIEYTRQKSLEKPVIILAEGDFGMSGDVLDVFVHQNEKIYIKGHWPLTAQDIIDAKKELKNNYVYVVYAQQEAAPEVPGLTLLKEYVKPGGNSRILFLELKNTK